MRIKPILQSFLALAFAVPCAAAAASDFVWNGGVDLDLEGASSLYGGARHGNILHGLALGHIEGVPPTKPDDALYFQVYASILALAGPGPTEHFLGDFLSASNIEGYNSLRLYSWWAEAHLAGWSLRAGALLADEEFCATEVGGNFFNSAFGWPAFISANTLNTGPAFYVAGLGLRLERRFNEKTTWRIGIYDGDTYDSFEGDPSVTRHGDHYRLGGKQGWFVISEATFAPGASATCYKVGGWLHTAAFADISDDDTGQFSTETSGEPRTHHGNYGGYVAIEHTLTGKAGQAGCLAAYVRTGFAPADRNTLSWTLDTGLAGTGLLPGRPADITALGLAHANFSPRFADSIQAASPSSPQLDYEQVVELTHAVVVSEHFTLQPDLQYIRHPGGSTAHHDALAFLLRIKASY
jgi:porin